MFYKGKLIVKNDEGIREQHDWGELNNLLCEETTADDEFTFGDMTYRPGGVRGPATNSTAQSAGTAPSRAKNSESPTA